MAVKAKDNAAISSRRREGGLLSKHSDLDAITFTVWPKDRSEADARTFHALSAHKAAEQHAREDWLAGATAWPISYRARDGITGKLWVIDVTIATQPSFVAIDMQEVPMLPTTHVLWGGRVLCEDLRLSGVPRDWPTDQIWISLKDVIDGVDAPHDRCETCWTKVSGLVEGLRQIGKFMLNKECR